MSLRSHGAFYPDRDRRGRARPLCKVAFCKHAIALSFPRADIDNGWNVAGVIALPLVFVKQRDWRGSLRTGIHP